MHKPHVKARVLALLLLFPCFVPAQAAEEAPEPAALAGLPLPQLTAEAEAGDDSAQFELGSRYLYGKGVEQDNFNASRWFRMAADRENPNAQYNLGVMALNGIGTLADFEQAMRWFQRAAGNGDVASQFTLGVIHANGRGVPQDLMQAHMWFTIAAAGGDRNASVNAVLFQEMLTSEQVEESQRLAREWIERLNKD